MYICNKINKIVTMEYYVEKVASEAQIRIETSHVSGFDPDTKKGFTTTTTTYTIPCIIQFIDGTFKLVHRTKIVFDNGVTLDWHWKELLLKEIKTVQIL